MIRTADRIVTTALVVIALVIPFERNTSGLIMLCAIIALGFSLYLHRQNRLFRWAPTAVDYWLWAYFGVCLLASLFSLDREASFDAFLDKLLVSFVLFYLLRAHIRAAARLKLMLAAMLLSGAVVCIYGMITYFWRIDPRVLETGRLFGTFGQPNRIAQYLLVLAGLAVAAIGATHSRKLRVLLGAELGLVVTTLFVTFSRAGWLAFVPTMWVFLAKSSRRVRYLIAGAVALLVIAIVVTPQGRARVSSDFLGGERMLIYRSSLRAFADHPVLGLGYGDRVVLKGYKESYRLPEARDLHSGTHNIFLQQAVETGLLGLVAFTGLHLALLASWLRGYRHSTGLRQWVLLWGLATLVAFFAMGQLHTLYRERNLMLFWLVAGLAEGALRGRIAEEADSSTVQIARA